MFLGHIALSAALATAVLGLWVWSRKESSSLLKIGGIIVLLVSISNMLCISYYLVRYWKDGCFKSPIAGMGMGKPMDCPMMQEMMKSGEHKSSPNEPSSDHEKHHE